MAQSIPPAQEVNCFAAILYATASKERCGEADDQKHYAASSASPGLSKGTSVPGCSNHRAFHEHHTTAR